MKNEEEDVLIKHDLLIKDGLNSFGHEKTSFGHDRASFGHEKVRYEDKLTKHQMMLSDWYDEKLTTEDLRKQPPSLNSMFAIHRIADDPNTAEVKPVVDHLNSTTSTSISKGGQSTMDVSGDGVQNFDLEFENGSHVTKMLCPSTGKQIVDDEPCLPAEVKPTKEQLQHADNLHRKQSDLLEQNFDQEFDDDNGSESQHTVTKPTGSSTGGQTSTDLVSDAGSALGSAVCCLAKCEALLLSVSDHSCDKALVSVIGKLKLIKDNLGSLLDELARVETNIQSIGSVKTMEPQVEIDEYEVKAEIPDDYDNLSDQENKDDKELTVAGDHHQVKMEMDQDKDEIRESCDNCHQNFRSYQALSMHKRHCGVASSGGAGRGARKSKKCAQCNKKFASINKYNIHMAKKHAEHKCQVCGLLFDRKVSLVRHRKAEKHFGDDEQQIQCDKCDKVLMSSYSYKNHVEHFHSKKRVCKICFEAFDIVKELREHMKNAHGEKLNNLSCSTCDDTFDSVISLHKHMNAANHGTYTCEVCSKVFASEATLKIHIKNRHSQNFKCSHCEELFDCKMDMRNHIKAMHTVKQQLVCQTCGHSTHSKGAFWRHLKIHGARTHKCEYCEKSFHVKHALTTHMRVHTGEKPYVCQICGTAFRKNSGLSRHKIVHTGEKPFVCYLCGKGFNQKGNLKTHMKSHISGNLPHPKD